MSASFASATLRRFIGRTVGWPAVVVVTALSACSTLHQVAHPTDQATRPADRGPSPEVELLAGATALEAGDFASARERLAPLTVGCLNLPVERKAALLRASAELDPTNPDGVPTTAATLTARVLVHSPAGEPDAALARSLYLLALDRGAAAPSEPHDLACEAPASGGTAVLPTAAAPSTTDRLTVLGDSLALRNDSIAVLRARALEAEERARVLEQELERIRQLLRGGVDPRP